MTPTIAYQPVWTNYDVDSFIAYFEHYKANNPTQSSVLLALNRDNHRHVDRLLSKIHKQKRSLPVEILVVRKSLFEKTRLSRSLGLS